MAVPHFARSIRPEAISSSARKHAVVILVHVEVSEKAERFNITARKSQMEKIDTLARQRGMTRSAYMVAAALGESGNSGHGTRR